MANVAVGIDLVKNVFAIHDLDATNRFFRKKFTIKLAPSPYGINATSY